MKTWIATININEVPTMGSRVLQYEDKEIAIFKTKDASIYAISNLCPHKKGKLSEGLVHEEMVTCPLHNWDIDLKTGYAKGEDYDCNTNYETTIKEEVIYIKL